MTETIETLTLGDALVRLTHLVDHVFADVSREHGVTPQQAQLLCRLVGEPVRMKELGTMLHLEKSSLTGAVDRLVARELVVRSSDPQDRRACHVTVTAVGARLANQIHHEITGRLHTMTNVLPASDRDHLVSAIAAILSQDVSRGSARPARRAGRRSPIRARAR